MRAHSAKSAVLISLLAASAQASQPPPAIPLEQLVCLASHIFVGTASQLRTVTSKELGMNCKDDEAVYESRLGKVITPCGRVEVGVKVEKVLYPSEWKPREPVRYQYGGGHFLVSDLRADLEGKRHLLLVLPAHGEPIGTFEPAYPWWLRESPELAGKVEGILRSCKRKVLPNQSLEPTRVGKPPLAAQLQR